MSKFTKATRKKVWMKMACIGPSGSGKTFSSLRLAFGLAGPQGRVAVIDSENGSASLYADAFAPREFDTLVVEPPFTTEKYIEAIQDASREGYDVLVIDSLSHAWAGKGGLLEQKEALDSLSGQGGNRFANWANITKKHEALKAAMLDSPVHVVATMRSKTEYEQDSSGKVRKVGTRAVQRDEMDYEFTILFDVAMDHSAMTSKDRTGLFTDEIGQVTENHGQRILSWLEGGAAMAPAPAPAAQTPLSNTSSPADAEKAALRTFRERAVAQGYPRDMTASEMGKLVREVLKVEGRPTVEQIEHAVTLLQPFKPRTVAPEPEAADPEPVVQESGGAGRVSTVQDETWEGPGQCPTCHAPEGKRHGRQCLAERQAELAETGAI